MQPQFPNERDKGVGGGKVNFKKKQKKTSLLMCYCSFAIGQFLTLKNQSENRLLN